MQMGQEDWILVSAEQRTSDGVWSCQGCDGPLLSLNPLQVYRPVQNRGWFYWLLLTRKWVFNCCSTWFLIYEREEEMHPKMCIQIKYSRFVMKYSVSLAFLWVTLPVELLLRKEAGCFNEPLGSFSQPFKLCLFCLVTFHFLSVMDLS